jgi:hypothetical protein
VADIVLRPEDNEEKCHPGEILEGIFKKNKGWWSGSSDSLPGKREALSSNPRNTKYF